MLNMCYLFTECSPSFYLHSLPKGVSLNPLVHPVLIKVEASAICIYLKVLVEQIMLSHHQYDVGGCAKLYILSVRVEGLSLFGDNEVIFSWSFSTSITFPV